MVRPHRARHPRREEVPELGEIVACLAIGMLDKVDEVAQVAQVAQCEQSSHGTEKLIVGSSATFHMNTSDDLLRDVRPSKDKVRIGNKSDRRSELRFADDCLPQRDRGKD